MSRNSVAKAVAAAGLFAASNAGASDVKPLEITGEEFSAAEIAGYAAEDMIVSVGPDGVESVILLAQTQPGTTEANRQRKSPTTAPKTRMPGTNTGTICCLGDTKGNTVTGKAISDDIEPSAEEKLCPGKLGGKGRIGGPKPSEPSTCCGVVGTDQFEDVEAGKIEN